MRDPVSRQWIGVVGLVAAASIVCMILVHYAYPWAGLALVSAAISAAVVVVATRPTRSLSDLIADVRAEPGQPAPRKRGTR